MEVRFPATWAEARDNLIPVLRRVTDPLDKDDSLVGRRFAPFLVERLVLDLPDVRAFLTREQLKVWSLTEDAAFTWAHDVLDPTYGLVQREDGVWDLQTDSYASSRLLLRGWLHAFQGKVEGAPVAIVPHTRQLRVGGAAQTALLLELAAGAYRDGDQPLSPLLYTIDDGNVVPYRPDGDAAIRAAERRFATREYGAQVYELEGRTEVPLQKCTLVDGERCFTVASWRRGEVWLLPLTDYVALQDGEEMLVVPTGSLDEECNREPALDPPRLRTHAFPSRGRWEELKSRFGQDT